MTRRPARVPMPLLRLVLLLAVAAPWSPPAVHAGPACTWQIGSASAPTPSTSVLAEVGEEVTLTGQFAPDAAVRVTLARFGVPVADASYAAAADGTLVISRTFTAAEVGNWELVATTEDGLCGPLTVFASIFPAGGSTEVTVKTYVCDASVQSPADYAARPGACDGVVLAADYPAPPGRTVVGLRAVAHGYQLTDAAGVVRPFTEAQLAGTGTCDMTVRECRYDYGYRWSYVPHGPTTIAAAPPPAGFRLGTLRVIGGSETVAGDASVTFDTAGADAWEVRFVWFAPPRPVPPAPPAPATGGLMPDTSVAARASGTDCAAG